MSPENIKELESHISLIMSTIRWMHGVMQILKAILAYSTRIILPDIAADETEGASDYIFCDIIQKYGVNRIILSQSNQLFLEMRCEIISIINVIRRFPDNFSQC